MLGRDSRSAMTAASAQPFLKSSRTRRLWSVLWIGFAFLAILLACILLYNNYSFRSQSRSQFNAQLDGALERATVWIVADPELSLRNPSIMYIISDMAKMSGEPRLQQLLYEYGQRLQHPSDALDLFWLRITDRHSPLPLIAAPELGDAGNERFWDAYALAPGNLQISNADRADLFSPTKYTWGTRHVGQRQAIGASPEAGFDLAAARPRAKGGSGVAQSGHRLQDRWGHRRRYEEEDFEHALYE